MYRHKFTFNIGTKQGIGQTKTVPQSLLPVSACWKKINYGDSIDEEKGIFCVEIG